MTPVILNQAKVSDLLCNGRVWAEKTCRLRDIRRNSEDGLEYRHGYAWSWRSKRGTWGDYSNVYTLLRSPFGPPCSKHWVRETWQVLGLNYDPESQTVDDVVEIPLDQYRKAAEKPLIFPAHPRVQVAYQADGVWEDHKDDRGFSWRSPATMPQWASRLTVTTLSSTLVKRDGVWVWRAELESRLGV